jgi:hypothetical protein
LADRRARPGKWLPRLRGALLLACLACIAPALAQDSLRAPGEVEVEAAYLVNFLRYTQWPAGSFATPASPYILTVVGSEAAAASVRAVAGAAGSIEGHPIEVRRLAVARGSRAAPFDSALDEEARAQLRGSHLVFFHRSAGKVHPQALTDLAGKPVLTVSDTEAFARQGGMLGLVRSERRIVFQANTSAIRNSGLLVSAKVLKLARSDSRSTP